MLHIKKGRVPSKVRANIEKVKKDSNWSQIPETDTTALRGVFDLLDKSEIRGRLVDEQRGLCAYCMRRIGDDPLKAKIEHFTPLSKNKQASLEYRNMLATCDGGEKASKGMPGVLTCDASKGDKDITIDPRDKAMMDRICYKRDGTIYARGEDELAEELNKDINDILRLNGKVDDKWRMFSDTRTCLVKGRKDAFREYEATMRRLSGKSGRVSPGQLRKEIERLEAEARPPQYVGVALFFLRRRPKSISTRPQ